MLGRWITAVVVHRPLVRTKIMKKLKVKDGYENGLCPDCGAEISDNAEEGDECQNCQHVFWVIRKYDDGVESYEGL